jgi:hypothetical protein
MLDLVATIDRRLRYLDRILPPIKPAKRVEPFTLEEPLTDGEIVLGIMELVDLVYQSASSSWARVELTKMLELLSVARDLRLKSTGEEDGQIFVLDGAKICLLNPDTNQKKVCMQRNGGASGKSVPLPEVAETVEQVIGGVPQGSVNISLQRLVEFLSPFYPPKDLAVGASDDSS